MKKLVSVAIAAAALMAAGSASALTVSFSDTFGPTPTELANEQLTLALFDDMGGTRTLNSVTISVAGDLDASGIVTNNNPGAATFRVSEFTDQFDGVASSGPASLQTLTVFPLFGATSIGSQVYNLAGGASGAFGPFAIFGSDTFSVTNAVDVATFVGPGNFTYDFNTIIGLAISGGGGNISTNINTIANGELTVVYDFDLVAVPVPAPAGIALFALGLLGMRRLRK